MPEPQSHKNTANAKRHRYLLPGVLPATNGGTAAEAKLCVGGGVAGGQRSDPASDEFLGWDAFTKLSVNLGVFHLVDEFF